METVSPASRATGHSSTYNRSMAPSPISFNRAQSTSNLTAWYGQWQTDCLSRPVEAKRTSASREPASRAPILRLASGSAAPARPASTRISAPRRAKSITPPSLHSASTPLGLHSTPPPPLHSGSLTSGPPPLRLRRPASPLHASVQLKARYQAPQPRSCHSQPAPEANTHATNPAPQHTGEHESHQPAR